MNLALIDDRKAIAALEAELGEPLDSPAAIAELLRAEVTARGRCTRHLAIERVCRLVAPVLTLDKERVAEVCESLVREGDLVAGEGGYLYPAPLRLVALPDGLCRLACSLPSRALKALAPGEWSLRGMARHLRPTELPEVIAARLGGVVLTPDAWAGLDRLGRADAGWLDSLDARLRWDPSPPIGHVQDEPIDWSACAIESDGPRWRAQAEGRLWRARPRHRGWIYAWSASGSPEVQSFVPLSSDEGTRTVFALARAAGHPITARTRLVTGDVVIEPGAWLPRAEYRYMSLCAEPEGTGAWRVPVARADEVIKTLEERLGLQFEEAASS